MKLSRNNILRKDKEKTVFCILFLAMVVYYGWRMFALTPWYDELYTYFYFISRGPVYAAIHWPLPNNHVGYSVLSGILDFFGNPYIGLRGISYLCALANMVLLFTIGRQFLKNGFSLVSVVLYVTMNLVNQQAVQGRGYTLGVTCYLTAFLCLIFLCREGKEKRWYYILFALSLVLGLYVITSNVYWVLMICLTGGCYLLYRSIVETKDTKEKIIKSNSFRKLLKLISASVIAALLTVGLYTIIWLAIGSNLLIKDAQSAYYGMGHVSVILKAPFEAIGAGVEYMLATPYIQSVTREEFVSRVYDWFLTLFGWYYDFLKPQILLILIIIGTVFLIVKLIQGIRNGEKEGLLLPLFLLCGIVCTPLFLAIQCTLPYYRVFVYGGVLISLLVAFMVQQMIIWYTVKEENKILSYISGTLVVLAIGCFLFLGENHHGQYSITEAQIQDAFKHANLQEADTLCVTDCNQQYLLKFLYNITCENTQIEGADRVLLDKRILGKEWAWEFYHSYDTIPWEYINNDMELLYENDGFVLYTKIESEDK